jgi:tRNA 2-thiocytidine biosynthesis protein TtcA
LQRPNFIYKTLRSAVGKAIHRHDMISDGDRIAVGLSGGADSMTLLTLLQHRLSRIPIKYHLFAIYIDPGFGGGFEEALKTYCDQLGIEFRIAYTDNGVVAHSAVNRENPCFLCSKLRRKLLFEIADEYGCRKLALGHNQDDVIETFFMNIFYAGETSTMVPAQSLFKGDFTIIRPLVYAENRLIRRFAKDQKFPVLENLCPSAGKTKRQEVRDMLTKLYQSNRKIRGNIFRAMHNVKLEYLLK